MNSSPCCCSTPGNRRSATARPASFRRRGAELVGWVIPSAALILMPKCPMCVAMYFMLFTGVSISAAGASNLRLATLILCSTLLFGAVLWTLSRRLLSRRGN